MAEDRPEVGYREEPEKKRVKYLTQSVSSALASADKTASVSKRFEKILEGINMSVSPVCRGLIAEEARDNYLVRRGIEARSGRTTEVVWALGEIDNDGVEFLHDLAVDFWNDIDERGYGRKSDWIDDDHSAVANLAMIRLTELHQQGKYSDQRMSQLIDTIGKVVRNSKDVFTNCSYLPDQFGLTLFWAEAFRVETINHKVWKISAALFTEESAIHNPSMAERERRRSFSNYLFDGINRQGVEGAQRRDLLIDYAYANRDYWGDKLNALNQEVFLGYMAKCMAIGERSPYWRVGDVKNLFSKEGVGSRFFDLITQNPDTFRKWYSRLYRGVVWIPEDEAKALRDKVIDWRLKHNVVLDDDEVFSCLHSWEYAGANTERLLDWVKTYSGDLACCIMGDLSNYREIAFEELENLVLIYDHDMKSSPADEARPAGVWLPILGEKLLMVGIDGKRAISFAGNLITEVQGVASRLRLSDQTQTALSAIHQHLHISETGPAAVWVRGLYSLMDGEINEFYGITQADVMMLMKDEEARSKLDLIRVQICREFSREKHYGYIKSAIDISRAIDTKERTYEAPPLKNLLVDIENEFEKGLNMGTVIKLSEMITDYHGKGRGRLLPIVLALREFFLDVGISLPKDVAREDLLMGGINIASFTGEIAPEALFAWKRLSKVSKLRADMALEKPLREDYQYLVAVQKSLKNYFGSEIKAADAYRHLTSRSMVDWLYRLTQKVPETVTVLG